MSKNGNIGEEFEKEMPALARTATRAAYEKAIRAGNTVVISEDGTIVVTSKNGESTFLKKIRPAKRMKKGEIIEIK